MAVCSVCGIKPANPQNEGAFGRHVCDDCLTEKQVDMDDDLIDLDEEFDPDNE